MEKLNFSININAPREKVWGVLFDDKTYRIWAAEFMPGSYAETDWKTGSKTLFLASEGNGMISRIAESRANEYLSIEHLGMVKDGKEDLESDEVKGWAGAHENYTLTGNGSNTELKIDMDADQQWKDYFLQTWPKALDKVKELAEKK